MGTAFCGHKLDNSSFIEQDCKSSRFNSLGKNKEERVKFYDQRLDSHKMITGNQSTASEQGTSVLAQDASGTLCDTLNTKRLSSRKMSRVCEEDLYSKKVNLDHFDILKVIGRGSFGKVFLVCHKKSGTGYAMKSIRKENFKNSKDKNNCIIERTILEKLKSQFVVQLHYAFQSPDKVYFVVDYMQGGDIFYHLQKSHRFCEKKAMFYIAEGVLALRDMHERGIIYRDLKLENIMLDRDGHIKITDFGLCRLGITKNTQAHSFVGTPEYLSPEVIKGAGYGRETDWWSLGSILYEMLSGKSPYYHKNVEKMLENILFKDLGLKDICSSKAKKLITKLLERDPKKRLGSKDGAVEIMNDPFFKDIDWDKLANKMVKPPFKPKILGETSVKYFSQEFINEKAEDSLVESKLTLLEKTENHFEAFTYGQEPQLLMRNSSDNNVSRSQRNSVIWEIDTAKEDLSEF